MDSSISDFCSAFGHVQGALTRKEVREWLLECDGCSQTDLDLLTMALDRVAPAFYVDRPTKG